MTEREHGAVPSDDAAKLERTAPFPPPTEDIVFLRGGVGVIGNIRRDSRGAGFTLLRPGESPEHLWIPIRHFDERLRDGDWARIQDFGEGPPEPDWCHSEVRRILPPSDEPPMYAVRVEPKMLTGATFGELVTIYGGFGQAFSRFRERDDIVQRGKWHRPDAWRKGFGADSKWSDADAPPMDFKLEALLELWYSVSRLTYSFFRENPGYFAENPQV